MGMTGTWAPLGYPASFAMGIALGLTGGGGSILTVPILVYLFEIAVIDATVFSLALVGLVAAWGAWGAFRHRELHLSRALTFGIPGVLGVTISRRLILPQLPLEVHILGLRLTQSSILLIAFATLMLAAALTMMRSARRVPDSAERLDTRESSSLYLGVIGFGVGCVVGLLGAGGGFLIVPALMHFGRLDMRQAIGTSLFVISLQSLLGVLGDLPALLSLKFSLFVSVALLALAGMTVGSKLRSKIAPHHLKFGFGIFVLMMGALILIQEIRKGIA